jgi:nucleoside-diphosphate-sugar epimerase
MVGSVLVSGEKLKAMGWRPRIALREGIADAYAWFLNEVGPSRLIRSAG